MPFDWSESVSEILPRALEIDLSKLGLNEAVQPWKCRSGDSSCAGQDDEKERLIQRKGLRTTLVPRELNVVPNSSFDALRED